MDALKLYLDICSYNRPFDSQTQMRIRLETEAKLFIQSGIREKKYSMVWSYMLDSENGANPDDEKREAISLWKGLADYYCSPSDDILKVGNKIMGLGINPSFLVKPA